MSTDNFNKTFKKDNEIEYILAVDVEYPESLQPFHKRYTIFHKK